MKPLHLLEVGLRWPPETFLRWKLEGLAARGMRVTLASRAIIDPDARMPGVELVKLPQRDDPRAHPWRVWPRAVLMSIVTPRRMLRLLRGIRAVPADYRRSRNGVTGLLGHYLPLLRMRPDLVHFEWNSAAVLYLPMFDVWRCPVVTSCHGSDVTVYPHVPGYELYAARLPEVWRRVTAVHCVSESLKHAAAQRGLDSEKARVIHQGVDPERFTPAARDGAGPSESFRILVVAWLRWMKGFEWAVAAVGRLVEAGVPARLEIVGGDPDTDVIEPSERPRILQTARELGIEDRVSLTGHVPTAEVARRLAGADVLLLSSLNEGLPTVILEAMAAGVPVVATDCGGVSEALTDGVEGLVVPSRDAEALAGALERLWRDPALRERMGAAGRETVLRRFTLQRQLEDFDRLYREVVAA